MTSLILLYLGGFVMKSSIPAARPLSRSSLRPMALNPTIRVWEYWGSWPLEILFLSSCVA